MLRNKLISGLCLLMLTSISLAQDTYQSMSSDAQPSLQLLEFLADYGAIDNQTYELIEYHALHDSNNENDQEMPDEN